MGMRRMNMISDVAIRVSGLGKCYQIYGRPQDRLKQSLWLGRRRYYREFWALRDASFEVHRGEAIGIIGRNGSGKSTLLQIVAGTVAPTTGDVEVNGRVAALLELGSGFNPEFSGRENVFLNGAILGMRPEEVASSFDEIAAFADIGDFIEQPVKIYSSGMLVRLAFAVQAFLKPDVLIVDEALAVGDLAFQHKCMRRIRQLLDGGTTLLFVSHGLDMVKRFCDRGLWLDEGQLRFIGDSGVAVEKYLAFMRMREAQPDMSAGEPSLLPEAPPAAVAGAPAGPIALLPRVAQEIDPNDDALFLKGAWSRVDAPGLAALGRDTSDPGAVAGFRCCGSELDLVFMEGPGCDGVGVWVDDRPTFFDLRCADGPRPGHRRLALGAGAHDVIIRPRPRPGSASCRFAWFGGVVRPEPDELVFRRDPALAAVRSEVERYGNGKARITAVELLDYATAQPVSEVSHGQRVRLRLHAERTQPAGPVVDFSYIVRDRNRIDLFGATTAEERVRMDPTATRFVAEFCFTVRLGPGSYSILAAFVEASDELRGHVPMDQIDLAVVFSVPFQPERPVWYVFHEPVSVRATVC